MFKSFQDNSALQQFHGFPNLNMQQATSAYGFSGVTFWLDAAYGLNTQTNLGAVSSWQQRVGGGTFVQATAANQPRLILSDANFNNLPTIETVDQSRSMDTSAGTGLKFNEQTTIAIISKVNTQNNFNTIISSGQLIAIYNGGNIAGYNGFGYLDSTIRLQGTSENTNARIQILTNTNIVVNGVVEATGTINRVSEMTRLFRLNPPTSNDNFTGNLAEIIAFGYSMTSDEAIALSNNINKKYALY